MESDNLLHAFKEEFSTMLRQQQEGHEAKIARMLDEHANRISSLMLGNCDLRSAASELYPIGKHEPPKPELERHSVISSASRPSQASISAPHQVEAMDSPPRRDDKCKTGSILSAAGLSSIATSGSFRKSFGGSKVVKTLTGNRSSTSSHSATILKRVMNRPSKKLVHLRARDLSDVPQPVPVHLCFENIVNHSAFEGLSVVAVLGNAFVIALQADWAIRHVEKDTPDIFDIVDMMFTVCFTIELLIRIMASGPKWFVSCQNTDVNWNALDTFLVLFALLESPLMLVLGSALNLTAARLLRMMRLVRMLRVVRLLRSFRQLRIVVANVVASLKPLLWALILLFAVIFLSSVLILQLLQGAPEASGDEIQELYGGLLRAQYTLFACVTNGVGWKEVAEPLVDVMPIFSVFFILYISFCFFCIVNIVTGIFVENAKAMTQTDDEMVLMEEAANRQNKLQEIRYLFEMADTDGSGELTEDEMVERLQDSRVQVLLQNLNIDILSVNPRGLFHSLDFGGTGTITIEEFSDGLMRFHGHARSLDLAELRHFTLQCLNRIERCKELVESHLSIAQRGETKSKPPPKPTNGEQLKQWYAEPVMIPNHLDMRQELS